MAKVAFLMANYGHDPTETALPYHEFKKAGFHIDFVTEKGNMPECDAKMLKGTTQKLLGATKEACDLYDAMREDMKSMKAIAWSDADFSLDPYDLVFLPGGHEKGVVQVINSPIVHKMMVDYFPQTKKPSKKSCAAICHGVMVLSESSLPNGKSVIHDVITTALPGAMEQAIFWATRESDSRFRLALLQCNSGLSFQWTWVTKCKAARECPNKFANLLVLQGY